MPPVRKKLTLSVDQPTLANARTLARRSGRSISRIFSEYVNSQPGKTPQKESEWLSSLAGKYRGAAAADRKSLRREMLKRHRAG